MIDLKHNYMHPAMSDEPYRCTRCGRVDLDGTDDSECAVGLRQAIARLTAKIDEIGEEYNRLAVVNAGLQGQAQRAHGAERKAQAVVACVEEWARRYGADLCPPLGSSDTFGDGVRFCKDHVAAIINTAHNGVD